MKGTRHLPGLEDVGVPAERLAGVDEAGRGPLAGAVYAAAVILPAHCALPGLDDSKKVPEARREALRRQIQARSLAWAVASASVEEIDTLNILQATLLAMRRAVEALSVPPGHALIDGNQRPRLSCGATAVVGGDGRVPAISAASILAKTARDEEMLAMEERYPGYGFARHKGYGTAQHLAALRELGPSPIHRRSFAPVRDAIRNTDPADCRSEFILTTPG